MEKKYREKIRNTGNFISARMWPPCLVVFQWHLMQWVQTRINQQQKSEERQIIKEGHLIYLSE